MKKDKLKTTLKRVFFFILGVLAMIVIYFLSLAVMYNLIGGLLAIGFVLIVTLAVLSMIIWGGDF